MKIAILCDTHFGVRGDSQVFLDHQRKFFDEIFFPVLEKDEITTVLHLGDVFDRRKQINFNTLKQSKEFFFEPLSRKNIVMHTILGNHDTFFSNTNSTNSVSLLLSEYENIQIYEQNPVELKFDNTRILMCPWLTKETYDKSMRIISESAADILCGHFGMKGFELLKGIVSDHGEDYMKFSHFESVYSGHFHHGSRYANVRYLGSQYEMTWADYESKKGFYILDTTTRELTFIENRFIIHHKIEYDDSDGLTYQDILDSFDVSSYQNCYIKVIVKSRTNIQLYDQFIELLNAAGAADIKTVEDILSLQISSAEEISSSVKDTRTILHTYVDENVESKIDKNRLKTVLDNLYTEALHITTSV